MDGVDAFGMLVQAKRVTVTGNRWSFDFGYKPASAARAQRDLLRSAASALDLLPVYALYLGTGDTEGGSAARTSTGVGAVWPASSVPSP